MIDLDTAPDVAGADVGQSVVLAGRHIAAEHETAAWCRGTAHYAVRRVLTHARAAGRPI
ncbi:hypothetical protein ACWGRF_13815 [Streptomyces zhihengii]